MKPEELRKLRFFHNLTLNDTARIVDFANGGGQYIYKYIIGKLKLYDHIVTKIRLNMYMYGRIHKEMRELVKENIEDDNNLNLLD